MIELTYHESRYLEEVLEDVLTVIDNSEDVEELNPSIRESVQHGLLILKPLNLTEEQ